MVTFLLSDLFAGDAGKINGVGGKLAGDRGKLAVDAGNEKAAD